MTKKRWIGLALGVAALGGLAFLGYTEALKRAWIRYNEFDIRSEGILQVGDLAPQIELASADGSGPRKLSELYREKPLVLVFGSYT
jgi:hypothetical protein